MTARRKRRLGKGLEALIPRLSPPPPPLVREVNLNRIRPNPFNLRYPEGDDSLKELADSIREHGLLHPLIVTEEEYGYQLVVGQRRWRAARLAGLETVPVIIKEAAPQEVLELALVENLQRADLNPLEEARAYRHLMDEFGLTQEEVAKRVGKSRSTVANSLRLLALSEESKRALLEGGISEGHGRALLRLKDPAEEGAVLQAIGRRRLSVRQTEHMIRRMVTKLEPKVPSEEDRAWEDGFRRALGIQVSLRRERKGGGRLVIHFRSEKELRKIFDLILRGASAMKEEAP